MNESRLEAILEARKEAGTFRSVKTYDTNDLLDLSANDYLSLTSSPALRNHFLESLNATSNILGSTGSRLLSGSSPIFSNLEVRLATHFGSPSALLFNSGWDANVSFFASVPQPGDWIVYDELIHASVHAGMRASRVGAGRCQPFRHNDVKSLRNVLKNLGDSSSSSSVVYVALESVYSMDGDFAPLPDLLDAVDDLIPTGHACVVVDEAHSTGVYGVQGRGLVHLLDETHRVHVRLMTFGKAVGVSGSVLLTSPVMRTFLVNFARPFIYSTAMTIASALAIDCAWDVLESREGEDRRQKLFTLSNHLNDSLVALLSTSRLSNLSLPQQIEPHFPGNTLPSPTPTPIHPILTNRPLELSQHLRQRGFIVRPVVPPTVPPGGERVRICLRADVTTSEIDGLLQALKEWIDSPSSRGPAQIQAKL